MPDFLPDPHLAHLHQLDLDARAGVDDENEDDEWAGITDEQRRRFLADEEEQGN